MKTLRQARTGFILDRRWKASEVDAPKFEVILDDLVDEPVPKVVPPDPA